jgi:hypothetical protein
MGETNCITAETQRSAEKTGKIKILVWAKTIKSNKVFVYEVAVPPQRKTKRKTNNSDKGKEERVLYIKWLRHPGSGQKLKPGRGKSFTIIREIVYSLEGRKWLAGF